MRCGSLTIAVCGGGHWSNAALEAISRAYPTIGPDEVDCLLEESLCSVEPLKGAEIIRDRSTTFLPRSKDTEVSQIQDMDIGIMPLDDSPWARRRKCNYKPTQHMACGLLVTTAPVRVHSKIMKHGGNGFMARDASERREAFVTLLNAPDLRQRIGSTGRRKVEREYSLQVYGPKEAQIFRDLIEGKVQSR